MRRRALICLLLASPLLLLSLLVLAGLRYTGTGSVPVGFYWAIPKAPEKGDMVMFEPPKNEVFDAAMARGWIPKGVFERYQRMIKRLVAFGGDVVTIDSGGVSVNGVSLTNSVPLPASKLGKPFKPFFLQDYRLKADEILVMSDYSRISFDGRYFGPIPRSCLKSVIRPIWTW